MTFENFDRRRLNLPLEEQDNLERAYNTASSFAEAPEGWLVFQGSTGCGKTHLAAAIGNYQLQKGNPVFFKVVPDLLDHLRSTFSPDSKVTYDELFERVKQAPFLILDDFGKQASTPWAQEKLYQIINYRYNARLPTVITTRLSLEEIELEISSRMIDPKVSHVFDIIAPDYRGDHTATEMGKQQAQRPRRRS
jgi:DNA replication protein DnaC